MITIEIEGIRDLLNTLDYASAMDVLMDPMQRSVLRLQRDIAQYPPQPPTDYRRTGRLGRSWTTRVQRAGDGVTGEVGTNVTYSPFVQSAQFQARWMRHWRNTDERVLEQNEDAIVRDFEQAISAVLG